jgi:hypothetical protein
VGNEQLQVKDQTGGIVAVATAPAQPGTLVAGTSTSWCQLGAVDIPVPQAPSFYTFTISGTSWTISKSRDELVREDWSLTLQKPS